MTQSGKCLTRHPGLVMDRNFGISLLVTMALLLGLAVLFWPIPAAAQQTNATSSVRTSSSTSITSDTATTTSAPTSSISSTTFAPTTITETTTQSTTVVSTTTVTVSSSTQTNIPVTVSSNPPSYSVVFVDGTAIATPMIFYWQPGSSHNFLVYGSANGYQFQYWQLDGSIYTYSPSFSYVITAPHTFVAVFNGQVGGQGGVPVTINSIPFTGYNIIQVDGNAITPPYIFYWSVGSAHFLQAAGSINGVPFQYWSLDGIQYTPESSFIYQVDGPHTLTAVFSLQPIPEFPGVETGITAIAMAVALIAVRRRKAS